MVGGAPAFDQAPLDGSNSSALPSLATRTLPDRSSTAAGELRGVPIGAVRDQAPVAGSNNSALASIADAEDPPAASTRPSGRATIAKSSRGLDIAATRGQPSVEGVKT